VLALAALAVNPAMPAASATADTRVKPRLSRLESGRFMDAPSSGRSAHPADAHGGTRSGLPSRNVTKGLFNVKKLPEHPFQVMMDVHLDSRLSSSGTVTDAFR
jgi:hypothetical protein